MSERPLKSLHLWVKIAIGCAIIALASVMRWKVTQSDILYGLLMIMGGFFISQTLMVDFFKWVVEAIKAWRGNKE